MTKDFTEWHGVKTELNIKSNLPTFQQQEIWWCSIGVNVGHEEDGKNEDFSRPVLVIKKFNYRLFWGVPLTTKIKANPLYHRIYFKGIDQCTMLSQLRLLDTSRLIDKMGKLSDSQFEGVKSALKAML